MSGRLPGVEDRAPRTDAPIVVADRFPATVTTPDGQVWRGARVVLTYDELFVWRADGAEPTPRGEPVLVARHGWRVLDSDVQRNRIWKIATEAGEFVAAKGGGCGCGSPLKTFVPWRPYRVGRL